MLAPNAKISFWKIPFFQVAESNNHGPFKKWLPYNDLENTQENLTMDELTNTFKFRSS